LEISGRQMGTRQRLVRLRYASQGASLFKIGRTGLDRMRGGRDRTRGILTAATERFIRVLGAERLKIVERGGDNSPPWSRSEEGESISSVLLKTPRDMGAAIRSGEVLVTKQRFKIEELAGERKHEYGSSPRPEKASGAPERGKALVPESPSLQQKRS